ncbi:MAG: flagellar biosynthesis regulator FlaF [Kordiimonadaceae bacterium]|nr:flagellar biosynthesis regulator FlaF [Kordiimonadaceae bacterium]MBO6570658.1 flagellar biosynthesis regulator FlaF [Kordiimonadaceae bacterium]MBO6966484.1 flagellar biosynthesis regulator FlaF [Kordiimonadaceae bacterium]
MSYQVYQRAQTSNESPSQIEYRLFAQVTNALIDVKDKPIRDSETIAALDWNRRMWSVYSSDCGAKGNQLPDQLRAGIISLAIWVSKHTSLVMRGKESIDNLININKTVMEGLADQAKLQADAAKTEAQPLNRGRPINASL